MSDETNALIKALERAAANLERAGELFTMLGEPDFSVSADNSAKAARAAIAKANGDVRPSGTCVGAGPAQFTDEQWTREQAIKARPSALGRAFAQDDATVLLVSHGWDRQDAQAFVAAIAKMIEARS